MKLLVDKLGLKLIFFSKRQSSLKEIIHLDSASTLHRVIFSFFRPFGIVVREKKFWLGDLEEKNGNNLNYKGVKLAAVLSSELSETVMFNNCLAELNEEFGRNTIRLRLAKCFMSELLEFSIKVVLLQSNVSQNQVIYLRKPYFIPWEFIYRSDKFHGIEFYSDISADIIELMSLFIRYVKVSLRLFYIVKRSYFHSFNFPTPVQGNVVLSSKEESVGINPRYRNQQFWIDEDSPDDSYYLFSRDKAFKQFSSIYDLGKTTILPLSFAGHALRKFREDIRFDKLSRAQSRVLKELYTTFKPSAIFASFQILILFRASFEIASISLMLNANKYVFKETNSFDSDGLQLVAHDIGQTTYALQYSNLGIKNPLMQSTADNFLIFSEKYKVIFSDEVFSPQNWIVTGYLYRETINSVRNYALNTRKRLKDLGVSLILGYFDENVQQGGKKCRVGKYGMVSREHHYQEINQLAQFVKANPKVAVIIKTQFNRNTTLQYDYDPVIREAKNSGRLVELSHGDERRNNIYPTEIALVADICVGNIVGGTASLEVALCGKRSALINPFKVKTALGYLLLNQEIIFSDLEEFLRSIKDFDEKDLMNTAVGDWAAVLDNFDPHSDESSFKRIRSAIL